MNSLFANWRSSIAPLCGARLPRVFAGKARGLNATVAALIAALTIIESEPGLTAKPLAKARAFTARLGLPEAQSPIVPLVLGEPEAAVQASNTLADEGFLVTPIRPPTVPVGTARLRFAFTALHPDEEIARLADAVRTLAAFAPARQEIPKCPQSS